MGYAHRSECEKQYFLMSGSFGLVTFALMSFSVPAFADSGQLHVGEATVHGSHCDSEKSQVKAEQFGPNTNIRLFFDSLALRLGATAVADKARSCQVSIPVTVPQGYRLRISQAEFRHKASLPSGSKEILKIAAYKNKEKPKKFEKTFEARGAGQEDVVLKKFIRDVLVSSCGEKLDLKVDASIALTGLSGKVGLASFAARDLKEFEGTTSEVRTLSQSELKEDAKGDDGAAVVFKTELIRCEVEAPKSVVVVTSNPSQNTGKDVAKVASSQAASQVVRSEKRL